MRYFLVAMLLAAIGTPVRAAASGLDSLSTADASSGLKAALSQSVDKAVSQLGASGGFLNNPKVTIPLPSAFEKIDEAMRIIGGGGDADSLKATVNHAAEAAVSQATPILKKALRAITLADAKQILSGGEDAATRYFRRASGSELTAKFKPIVAKATARLKLAGLYDQYAGKAAQLGLLSPTEANVNDYVTAKALDGLFVVMADEEKAIRQDPLGQASALIRKVFGAGR
jgi:Protein of unknown function (DUF4197)